MLRKRPLFRIVAVSVTTLVLAAPALASDGALEIHQSCVATGCFPGDTPGYPVELTVSGSYVLTSNLEVPDENTTAILADADSVSLDLGGFTISGITDCSGTPVVCDPVGTGDGVGVQNFSLDVSVRNGTVRGMGRTGVSATTEAIELRVIENGLVGIQSAKRVHGCHVFGNGDSGIAGSDLVVGNTVTNNGGNGILGGLDPLVQGNRLRFNGRGTNAAGILVDDGLVLDNLVLWSGGPGLDGGLNTVYTGNHFRSNNSPSNAGNQVVGGTQLGGNICQGAPCP